MSPITTRMSSPQILATISTGGPYISCPSVPMVAAPAARVSAAPRKSPYWPVGLLFPLAAGGFPHSLGAIRFRRALKF